MRGDRCEMVGIVAGSGGLKGFVVVVIRGCRGRENGDCVLG